MCLSIYSWAWFHIPSPDFSIHSPLHNVSQNPSLSLSLVIYIYIHIFFETHISSFIKLGGFSPTQKLHGWFFTHPNSNPVWWGWRGASRKCWSPLYWTLEFEFQSPGYRHHWGGVWGMRMPTVRGISGGNQVYKDECMYLGGGNSNIFGIFIPTWEDEPILMIIFFKWVETTN